MSNTTVKITHRLQIGKNIHNLTTDELKSLRDQIDKVIGGHSPKVVEVFRERILPMYQPPYVIDYTPDWPIYPQITCGDTTGTYFRNPSDTFCVGVGN